MTSIRHSGRAAAAIAPAAPPAARPVTAGGRREPRRIQSIEVGFRLIRALESSETPLALKEVAARAGMASSKALLYLASFCALGVVARDASGQYALGPYALALGLAALRRTGIADIAAEPLRELSERTKHSAYLSLWGNRGPTIVLKCDNESRVPVSIRIGHVLPLEGSATGMVFLAHLPEQITRALPQAGVRRSAARVIDTQLAALRRDGVAVSSGRVNSGFAAMAAPVFDHRGELAAAVTLLGPESRIDTDPRHAAATRLRAAAAEISRRLGAQDSGASASGAGDPANVARASRRLNGGGRK